MSTAQHIKVIIGSSNQHKVNEIQTILQCFEAQGMSFEAIDSDDLIDVVEDGETFVANAELKATVLAKHLNRWVLADDSGLEVDYLDGAPGIYSARYAGADCDDQANNQKLVKELGDLETSKRTARYQCVIVLASPGHVHIVASGSVEGQILQESKGSGGFGYDPLFYYPPAEKTFAEMLASEKDAVSHRAVALQDFQKQLSEFIKLA